MGYLVEYDSMDTMRNSAKSTISSWQSVLNDFVTNSDLIIEAPYISGATAESIKLYIEMVYIKLPSIISDAISLYYGKMETYITDYLVNVDKYTHAKFKEEELIEYKRKTKSANDKESLNDDSIQNTISEIADLVSIKRPDMESVYNDRKQMQNVIKQLMINVENTENAHKNSDFEEIASMIVAISDLIASYTAKNRSFIQHFSTNDVISNPVWASVFSSAELIDVEIETSENEMKNAEQLLSERDKVLQAEFEERQRKAQILKYIVAGVAIVASIALAASGAGILVAALISGSIAAGSSIANNAIDVYLERGSIDRITEEQKKKMGKDACVSFVSSAASSCASGAIGQGFKSSISAASGIKKVGLNVASGLSSSLSSGSINRVTTKLVGDGIDGKFDPLGIGKELIDYDNKGRGIVEDLGAGILEGLGSSATDGIKDSKFGKKFIYNVDGQGKTDRVVGVSALEGIESMVEGGADRGLKKMIDNAYDGKDLFDGVNDEVFDNEEALKDGITGIGKSAVKTAQDYKGQEIESADRKSSVVREELDGMQSTLNSKEVFKQGGKIYRGADGSHTVVYEDETKKTGFDTWIWDRKKNYTTEIHYDSSGKIDYGNKDNLNISDKYDYRSFIRKFNVGAT